MSGLSSGRMAVAAAAMALSMGGWDRPAAAADPGGGVIVRALKAGLAGEKAGLRAGDRLLRWEQGAASGVIASPFDLAELEIEYGPRGPVGVVGRRGEEPLSVSLFPDAWGIDARPTQEDEAWRLFDSAREAAGRRQVDAAVAAIEAAVRAAADRPISQAHLLAFLGQTLMDAERLPEAAAAFDRAMAVRARGSSGPLAVFQVADPVSRLESGPSERRQQLLKDAIAAHERLAPESLALARLLDSLAWRLGGQQQAALVARALPLAERLAPQTSLVAQLLFSAAWVEREQRATELLERAAAIQQRVDPESRQTAITLSFLGRYLDYIGDGARALEYEEKGLRMMERIAPGSGDHAHTINNLALYWAERGDYVQAEALYRQTLEIDERRNPDGFGAARGHYNLGRVLFDRRDFEQAETHLRKAWQMTETFAYGPNLGVRALSMLGQLQHERGDLKGAEAALRRVVELAGRVALDQLPNTRERLANLLTDEGSFGEAEALYRQNVESATASPLRFGTAQRHQALARFALRKGDLDTAERHHRAALELRRGEMPGSMEHAESAHGLGVVARRRGRRDEALALFREAVDALEAQGRRLGGGEETRAAFRGHYQEFYRDLEELLLDLGRGPEAFQVLERSRAQGLPALLASRSVGFGARLSPELERERRRAEAEYDRAFAALTSPRLAEAERARASAEHDASRRRLEEVLARVRSASPRAAAMRDPEPLDLAAVQSALDEGTLLLAFSLGTASSRVYAVGPGAGEFAVLPVSATRAEAEEAVRAFRTTIARRRSSVLRGAVARQSAQLSRALLAPAADRIARARRLLIVPDGPLYLLPFAALTDPSRASRFLVEALPLNTVSSMTLHEVLAQPWEASAGAQVVGFGDPAYGTADAGPARASLERARRAGLRLDPLPATRAEVEVLRRLSPSAHVWTGAEATEERAKAIGPAARVVHFACHGFVDETLPLESGLALTTSAHGDRENGFLQAWEVFESVRVDADLVTLSACETGLGKDMGAEGLLGLAWAFQYAGARSVLASLWEVNDASTAALMRAFYTQLAAGATKAQALRRAQVAVLRRPATAAPYYWAAFTLIGAGR